MKAKLGSAVISFLRCPEYVGSDSSFPVVGSISFPNLNFKNEAFKYSIQNFESQQSLYSFKLIKSEHSFEYNFCWTPTKKLSINTKIINNTLDNDNNFFYNANASFTVLRNNIFSIGINSLRFHDVYNSKKWNKAYDLLGIDPYSISNNIGTA